MIRHCLSTAWQNSYLAVRAEVDFPTRLTYSAKQK
jgi:hypothetical protein